MAVVTGLTAAQAADVLHEVGPNAEPRPDRPAPLWQLARQFTHFFALMLWGAAALALLAGLPPLAVAIACVILINGIFIVILRFNRIRLLRILERA